ncbi:hypothetical protein ARALYDRAFT_920561 [Arabidopsis lyrata subsp. lyrata]|uniref:Uncharacterized protein n=1 Tax=Arabidopsis lyrata subsp. lyrata TaxID=81972 RepID=D7MXC4_ARALL|nr:hypothetical protein ARALYDRAFT_920561 [Arabidopsis lyrata subsp. lyrata]
MSCIHANASLVLFAFVFDRSIICDDKVVNFQEVKESNINVVQRFIDRSGFIVYIAPQVLKFSCNLAKLKQYIAH